MGFLDPGDYPEGCTCCWIMGYGVDEENPNEWAQRQYSVDEECEFHGAKAGDSGGDVANPQQLPLRVERKS